jgi:hypothetical protein
MPKKNKMDFTDKIINKTLLIVLSIVFGILSIIGYATHFLIGTIFVIFFCAAFGALIGMDKLTKTLENLNNRDW